VPDEFITYIHTVKLIMQRNIGKFAPNQAKTARRCTVMVQTSLLRQAGTALC
jgi:hypothetical protein